MDMLEHTLDSSGDAEVVGLVDSKDMLHHELAIVEEGSLGSGSEGHNAQLATQSLLEASGGDEEVQYAFRSSGGGTVTYRVVQVDDSIDPLPQIVSPTNFSNSVQQVLTTPLNGQLYVIGNPSEVFSSGNQRTIVPRSNAHVENTTVNTNLKKRDDRRRATHNEVERRRRDKINSWIMKLSKIIPDSNNDITKGNGSFEGQSKGGILAKACEYILELRQSNQRLSDCLKDNEQLSVDNETLRQQNEQLKRDNAVLRAQLQQSGIQPAVNSSRS